VAHKCSSLAASLRTATLAMPTSLHAQQQSQQQVATPTVQGDVADCSNMHGELQCAARTQHHAQAFLDMTAISA
jgi:hypothetical protein